MKRAIIITTVSLILLWILGEIDFFLREDTCRDGGGVWDYDEDRCREDCLLWNDKYGCVQMTPEHMQAIKDCRMDRKRCDVELIKWHSEELCMKYSRRINPNTGRCTFE